MAETRRKTGFWWIAARVLGWAVVGGLLLQILYFLVGFIWIMIAGIPPESWDI